MVEERVSETVTAIKAVRIRRATPADAEALLGIYAPYVEHTVITFEYLVPTVEEFRERIRHTLEKYPYILAEQRETGEILGYAYTGPFKERAAYDWGVETTVYVKQDCKRGGIGKKLYTALEKVSAAQHILNMNACIGYPVEEDEYLTQDSAHFHEHLGYRLVGEFHSCGFKFGRWYDMIWMEKLIGAHTAEPDPVIPFPKLDEMTLHGCGME
ncbi:GNAT family N-acetyltransferase [Anaerosacchariphilus sp. NSJ-68]|uniref:GNAT family N-acetyltransferase n=2 Tax=Lachnospiraceae TaxID=186803 RepID=A0A923LE35_9FIRM|nr:MULTISPECIES: GNAT family N-acetyltransferase [Lachnospiraceae]MBC5660859.1 GNAT family N-acetyltransferase [Anaerosacchariphilus hominis]MBC5698080.1 GNAT family N-acetyltransferase [Roseburia difficilis]